MVLLVINSGFAQVKPVKVAKNANHFLYEVYDYGEKIDTSLMKISLEKFQLYWIFQDEKPGRQVPGYAYETTYVDLKNDSTYLRASFKNPDWDETVEGASPFSRSDIAYDTARENGLTRYTCHINSNTLEFFVQDFPSDITPLPYYGRFKGIVVCFKRNNQTYLQLVESECKKKEYHDDGVKRSKPYRRVSARELSQMKKERLVITTRIFEDVQLSWGQKNDHVEGDYIVNMPYDSVLHFAGGTLALKRVRLPRLPDHYQTFIELHQRSNGDAYDRTGSVFVIPGAGIDLVPNFFDGINNHPDSLPVFVGKDGQRYQGFIEDVSPLEEYQISSSVYSPPVELMRFFTPFGVGHFKGGTKMDHSEFFDQYEWYLMGTIPYFIHIYLQLGVVGLLWFIVFLSSLFIRHPDGFSKRDLNMQLFLILLIGINLFYIESLRDLTFCIVVYALVAGSWLPDGKAAPASQEIPQ